MGGHCANIHEFFYEIHAGSHKKLGLLDIHNGSFLSVLVFRNWFQPFQENKPDFLIDPLKFGKIQQSDAYKLEVTIFEMCS
jgi:hypothetical protein